MSQMRKLATSEASITIEWRSASSIDELHSVTPDVSRDDVIELARALGRLAARRDIKAAAARIVPERLRLAEKQGRMGELKPS